MTRNEKIARGSHAKILLESETFVSLMDALMGESYAEYISTGDCDTDTRDAIWARGQALIRIRGQLEHYISDASVEKANAEYDNDK
jgi:hypothetical protein